MRVTGIPARAKWNLWTAPVNIYMVNGSDPLYNRAQN